jgi:hypothetical protein
MKFLLSLLSSKQDLEKIQLGAIDHMDASTTLLAATTQPARES